RKSRNRDYGLYQVFKHRIRLIKKIYPMMRFLPAKKAVPKVEAWKRLNVKRWKNGNKIYTVKSNPQNKTNYWFMYASASHIDTLKYYLNKETEKYHLTPVWDGYLVQMKSNRDSLIFPDFWRKKRLENPVPKVKKEFAAYIKADTSINGTTAPWHDNRLEKARAALQKEPTSRAKQDRLINLAVEFNRVPIAINILEKRIRNDSKWRPDDINKLLKYYGWQSDYAAAYHFLNLLWHKYHDKAVINLKDKMIKRLGVPNQKIQEMWIKRTLRFQPGNKQLLQRYITGYQPRQNWPQRKAYLRQLIKKNPSCGALYYYVLQGSFYYDKPASTLKLLNGFPDDIAPELKPLAPQIAKLYGYTAKNYSRALQWANRASDFPIKIKLDWLIQEKRYKAFLKKGDHALHQQPHDDSLRSFIGKQLIYAGYSKQGYSELYPLFKNNKDTKKVKKMVNTDIGYKSFKKQRKFYQQYPAFFSDSLMEQLQLKYRAERGVQFGTMADYAADNFQNTIANAGAFIEWGNREKYLNRIQIAGTQVGSDTTGDHKWNLVHATYRFQRIWPVKGVQFTALAGIYSTLRGLYHNPDKVRPDARLGVGYGVGSTYTAFNVKYEPVFTTVALNQKIGKVQSSFYREDYLFNKWLRMEESLDGKWFSNDVYTYSGNELTGIRFPFSSMQSKFYAVGQISYADATKIYTSGFPYYTPDQLLTEGGGIDYRFQSAKENPGVILKLKFMAKHDRRDGYYITSTAQLKARIDRFWKITLYGHLSSSSVYHYNHLGLTLSYLFPRHLNP
ncbi:MAG TPA: hypothetical protein VE868_11475, partial [Balneolaceae bacterium]|nr:hypothetical protein [Balneolaceae bacterium]